MTSPELEEVCEPDVLMEFVLSAPEETLMLVEVAVPALQMALVVMMMMMMIRLPVLFKMLAVVAPPPIVSLEPAVVVPSRRLCSL